MTRQIVDVLGRADRPLTFRELQAQLPEVRRERLRELVDRGVLYPCTRGRFWDRDETAHLVELAIARLGSGPRTRRDLVEWLAEVDPGLPQRFRSALYDQVREVSGVFEWPGGAGHRAPRLATRPPDPGPYLAKVRAEFERVRDQLVDAGLEPALIVSALTGDAPAPDPPAAPPRPAGGPDVLNELAFAWSDSPVPARAPIERVLVNVGAQRLGQEGESVRFDGRLHETEDDLFPDEPAAIVQPGWIHGTAQRRVVLVRARVRAAP